MSSSNAQTRVQNHSSFCSREGMMVGGYTYTEGIEKLMIV